jgi:hypothetical protein
MGQNSSTDRTVLQTVLRVLRGPGYVSPVSGYGDVGGWPCQGKAGLKYLHLGTVNKSVQVVLGNSLPLVKGLPSRSAWRPNARASDKEEPSHAWSVEGILARQRCGRAGTTMEPPR